MGEVVGRGRQGCLQQEEWRLHKLHWGPGPAVAGIWETALGSVEPWPGFLHVCIRCGQ